jgi:hypothetical protein
VIGRPMSATNEGLVVLPLQNTFWRRWPNGYLGAGVQAEGGG